MWDYLTFNTFIAKNILLFFYYMGVLFVPVLLWYLKEYLNKKVFIIVFVFIFAELFWRMFFEMLIGYFDMHDYLQVLSSQS